MTEEMVARAVRRPKGNFYEDFTVGQVFDHHWGRTINEGDNSLFTTLTLSLVMSKQSPNSQEQKRIEKR